MHRRKPASAKQRKAQLQLKRAIKRGDAPPPDPRERHHKRPKSSGSKLSESHEAIIASSRRLQSSFVKLPASYLEEAKNVASTVPLLRPIPLEAAVLDNLALGSSEDPNDIKLTCPKRPKWRYDMTKKAVEKNEEGMFNKWLAQTDASIAHWLESGDTHTDRNIMPRSPTYFERNVEVWRQLWRVMEISQIILVLLDSRCPLIHFPPSLSALVSDRRVIFILTKVDISGPVLADAWTSYLKTQFPTVRVVQVESFVKQEETPDHQGKTRYQPHLQKRFRESLVDALREVHAEMLEPPDKIRGDPTRLAIWKPSAKRSIDWEGALIAEGPKVGNVAGDFMLQQECKEEDETEESDQEPEFLTIGLIGQPNVGKSSLLNALFNANKVHASRTPGKTKHFQTLFWTQDVRLVDCPGIVMPNFVPMEMQVGDLSSGVLCGVLPISRISAIPSCIYHVAQYLPLERIFNLTHPALASPPVEDKRTWRDGIKPSDDKKRDCTWTTMDILTAFALMKGWVTAKAGRPDVNRAGNAILRSLAEGRIGWAFWPPGTDVSIFAKQAEEGAGIWIPHVGFRDEENGYGSEREEGPQPASNDETSEDLSSDQNSEGEHSDMSPSVGFGRFGALSLDAEDED